MKHFGNSLSYEEIIEDMKEPNHKQVYIGVQIETKNFGNYIHGEFVPTGVRKTTNTYKIVCQSGKCSLISNDDSGSFDTLQQAKNRAREIFGIGIKWRLKQ